MKIYLASGFFTEETRKTVILIAHNLRNAGHEVFVPMEHEIENAWNKPNKQWAKEVFAMDKQAIDECDKVVYLDFGYQGDCGAAWEVGYAYAKGKQITTLAFGENISLMIANSTNIDFCPEQK